MSELGRILIADDDETFLRSTADLLRKEGYECDCAADAQAASEMLGASHYDLLIADIRMPGNGQLEFVRSLPHTARGLPVILVTGYPSLHTAIESIQLPVVAYMVKPPDFDELLERVRVGIQFSGTYGAVDTTRKRLQDWSQDLTSLEQLMRLSRSDAAPVTTSAFLNLTMSNMAGTLSDLKNLTELIALRQGEPAACHLLNCPRPAALIKGLKEAVSVLEKTKRAFKSKELGELRQSLQGLINQAGEA